MSCTAAVARCDCRALLADARVSNRFALLEQKPVRIALPRDFASALGHARAVLQEVLAEATHLLDGRVVIALGIQQLVEILAHLVRRARACGEAAIGRARLARDVVRAAVVRDMST